MYARLSRRWSIRRWTRGLRDVESAGDCTVGLGQWRVMQWRASVSGALVAGGFWRILLARRRRSRRASRRERERERFQNPGGNTLTAWISLAIPFIANEWTCREGGGLRPLPSPTLPHPTRANLSPDEGPPNDSRSEKNKQTPVWVHLRAPSVFITISASAIKYILLHLKANNISKTCFPLSPSFSCVSSQAAVTNAEVRAAHLPSCKTVTTPPARGQQLFSAKGHELILFLVFFAAQEKISQV